MEGTELTLKKLIAMTMADVDIYLLQNEQQTEDNDQESFTREEIREQLHSTMSNVCSGLKKVGCSIDKPLISEDILFEAFNPKQK